MQEDTKEHGTVTRTPRGAGFGGVVYVVAATYDGCSSPGAHHCADNHSHDTKLCVNCQVGPGQRSQGCCRAELTCIILSGSCCLRVYCSDHGHCRGSMQRGAEQAAQPGACGHLSVSDRDFQSLAWAATMTVGALRTRRCIGRVFYPTLPLQRWVASPSQRSENGT
jgi:hypothetical protein